MASFAGASVLEDEDRLPREPRASDVNEASKRTTVLCNLGACPCVGGSNQPNHSDEMLSYMEYSVEQ